MDEGEAVLPEFGRGDSGGTAVVYHVERAGAGPFYVAGEVERVRNQRVVREGGVWLRQFFRG